MKFKPAEIYYGAPRGKKDIKKPWYVYWYEWNPKREPLPGYVRFIEKGGINRFHGITDRTCEARKFRDAINLDLKAGICRFRNVEQKAVMTFAKAVEHYLTSIQPSVAPKTHIDYRSRLKAVKTITDQLGLSDLPISEVDRSHIKSILTHALMQGSSKHRRNTLADAIKGMYGFLLDEETVKASPVHGIRSEPLSETEGYVTYPEHRQKVKKIGYDHSFSVGLIFEALYLTMMRPNELLGLQWNAVNFNKLEFTLMPEVKNQMGTKERVTKTLKIRYIPGTKELFDKLRQHYETSCTQAGLEHIPGEWFVFATSSTFLSGPTRIHRNRLTDLWRELFHKSGELPVSMKMYGIKHTRADVLIDEGFDLETIKDLAGHHSTKITRLYARKKTQKSLSEIRERASGF